MRRSLLCVALAAGLTTLTHVEAQGQGDFPLESLTVPADRLSAECRLTPTDTVMRDGNTFSPGFWDRLPISSNPWRGTLQKSVVGIMQRITGPTRLPDGPPMTPAELAQFNAKYAEGVEEAYAAVYADDRAPRATVLGVRFDQTHVPATPARESRQPRPLVLGRTMIVLPQGDSPCAETVRAHVTQLANRYVSRPAF